MPDREMVMGRPLSSTLVLLLRAGRIHFLLAGFLLYLLGALYAVRTGSPFSLLAFLAGYGVSGTAHLSVSYSNDYFDRDSADPQRRSLFSGGGGVLPLHPDLARPVLLAAIVLSLLSLSGTAALVLLAGFPPYLLVFVAAGLATGWGYSAPPLCLSRRGLGEVSTMAAFGIFLPGAGYLFLAGHPDPSFLWLAIPLFLAGLFFIVSVELPDLENDRKTGKETLVVRIGPLRALVAGTAAVAAAMLLFLLAAAGGEPPGRFFLASAAALVMLLLAGAYGIGSGTTDSGRTGTITLLNITVIVLFLAVGIVSLAAGF